MIRMLLEGRGFEPPLGVQSRRSRRVVAAGLGFEPRLSGPEPDELPLLHPAINAP